MITIVLLSCSINLLSQNNNDSIKVSISDIRVANSKMIELNYQKEINNTYKEIVYNDSIIINKLNKSITNCQNESKTIKTKNKYLIATNAVTVVLLILSIIF